MEDPTLNNTENKNSEDQTATIATEAGATINETTASATKEEQAPELAPDESEIPAEEPDISTPSDEKAAPSPEDPEPVIEDELAEKTDEPPKIDVAAAEAEPAAKLSIPESTTEVAGSSDTAAQGQSSVSSLAIDNEHPISPSDKHGASVIVVAVLAAVLGLAVGFVAAGMIGFGF